MENKMDIKILLIDNSPNDASLIVHELKKYGFALEYEIVDTQAKLHKAMKKKWDAIISGYVLPGFNGIDALRIVRAYNKDIPFILVSGTSGEEIAVEAMRAGAHDYIMKDRLTRLGPAVLREINNTRDREKKHRAIQSLAESEAGIKNLFISAPIGIGIINNRQFQYVNDRMCEIVGYSREELVGHSIRILYESVQEIQRVGAKKYPEFLKKGIATVYTRYKMKDGKTIYVLVNSSPIDKNDISKGFTFTVHDISEHVKQEKLKTVLYNITNAINIAESIKSLAKTIKEELGQIIDTSNFYIALFDKESNTLSLPYFEDEKDRFTDIPAGKTLTKYVIDEGVAKLLKYNDVEELIKKGVVERLATPSKCWMGVPLKKDGVIVGVLGVQNYHNENSYSEEDLKILEIVSEQIATSLKLKLAQDSLKESERRFRVLANASDQAVFIVDRGYCIDANNKASEMLGYTYKEMLGAYAIDFIAPEFRNLVNKNMLSNYTKPYEVMGVRKDGSKFPILIHGRMLEYKGKKVRLTTVRDLTWEKENEKEILKAKERAEESDKLKTAFLANMSHEIRTPMNGIIGFSEMFLQPGLTDETRREYAKIVIESSQQLLSIVNNILDISRIEAGQVKIETEIVNIPGLIKDLYSFFEPRANDKAIMLVTQPDKTNEAGNIYADKTKLTQILSNLLSNALKFTQTGHVKLGYNLEGDNIHFFVRDTGIGIPDELHDKVFERFRQAELELTRQYGGAGLGLSISKKLVELMGGRIWLESTEGVGSTFNFTVPYKPVVEASEENINKEEDVEVIIQNEETTILVAEDEELNLLFIKEILKKSNFKILYAMNGLEAIELFQKYPEVRLVLMDLKMPVVNGFEAAKEIKKMNSRVPIIAQTAFAMPEDREKALMAGFDEYISKPINKTGLLSLIESLLSKYN